MPPESIPGKNPGDFISEAKRKGFKVTQSMEDGIVLEKDGEILPVRPVGMPPVIPKKLLKNINRKFKSDF